MGSRDDWAKIYERRRAQAIGNLEILSLGRSPVRPLSKKTSVAAVPKDQIYPLVRMCRAAGLPEPVPEYVFHPTRKWRFDYAFVLQQIAVEIEGGIWRKGGGAHSHPLNIQRDMEKYNAAAVLGWRLLRVAPEDLACAIELVRSALESNQ